MINLVCNRCKKIIEQQKEKKFYLKLSMEGRSTVPFPAFYSMHFCEECYCIFQHEKINFFKEFNLDISNEYLLGTKTFPSRIEMREDEFPGMKHDPFLNPD